MLKRTERTPLGHRTFNFNGHCPGRTYGLLRLYAGQPHLPNRQRLSAQVALYRGHSDRIYQFDLGAGLIERVFALEIRISMIIESGRGAPILYLTIQEGASVKLENIDKSIQKQDILQGISLEVSPQKLTAFIGPNGAGKSTLLSIMSRLTKKDQGILSIKGREIESWNSQELAQELTILKQKINYQAKLDC